MHKSSSPEESGVINKAGSANVQSLRSDIAKFYLLRNPAHEEILERPRPRQHWGKLLTFLLLFIVSHILYEVTDYITAV
jgi:hypothetical protein